MGEQRAFERDMANRNGHGNLNNGGAGGSRDLSSGPALCASHFQMAPLAALRPEVALTDMWMHRSVGLSVAAALSCWSSSINPVLVHVALAASWVMVYSVQFVPCVRGFLVPLRVLLWRCTGLVKNWRRVSGFGGFCDDPGASDFPSSDLSLEHGPR